MGNCGIVVLSLRTDRISESFLDALEFNETRSILSLVYLQVLHEMAVKLIWAFGHIKLEQAVEHEMSTILRRKAL